MEREYDLNETGKKPDSAINEISINELLGSISNVVFGNVKLYVDKKFQELESFIKETEDAKLNIATLSSLLHEKKLFTQEEYRNCFFEIEKSFGIVRPDGTMDGRVEITKYNFK